MQSSLTSVIGTVGATQVRFLYGWPFALLFLVAMAWISGETVPEMSKSAFAYLVVGALAQIGATALMLATMTQKSFSVTTAYIKTEPVLVALAGFLLIGDALTPLKLLAIVIATSGVLVISMKPGTAAAMLTDVKPALLGVLAGGLFGLSAIGFRGAITALDPGSSFYLRATTILVWGLCLQTIVLGAYLALFDRKAMLKSFTVWRQSLFAGFLGAFASQFWFLGFSLTSAANVRTLALVEIFMAQLVSRRLFSQAVERRELWGMALIVAGVALLLRIAS